AHPEPVVARVLAQLDALGVGFGACHTEFVVHDGRARVIEVNYRAIGDHCDLLLARLLGLPLFEHILRTHLGEPLPAGLGARRGAAARLEYPCADRAGTLVAGPSATELHLDGVDLTYRPLRGIGEHHALYRTNRDYLGVLTATTATGAASASGQQAVDRVAADFLAAQRWEIRP
ncbi:siderophore biosynthesis protein, partial [Streptomyces sp. ND04-05B]|nr:siderophore biosynthesis protein [Streptomyces sp. ND04-05B]